MSAVQKTTNILAAEWRRMCDTHIIKQQAVRYFDNLLYCVRSPASWLLLIPSRCSIFSTECTIDINVRRRSWHQHHLCSSAHHRPWNTNGFSFK